MDSYDEQSMKLQVANKEIESLNDQMDECAKKGQQAMILCVHYKKGRDEWKRRALHLRDWVKHQHGIGTAVGLGEVNEICLEAEYTDQFPEMRAWIEEE